MLLILSILVLPPLAPTAILWQIVADFTFALLLLGGIVAVSERFWIMVAV